MDSDNEIELPGPPTDYLVWYMKEGNRICGSCHWLVISEKNYYWCIGCERTQKKGLII